MSASSLPAPRLAPRGVRRALIAASAVGALSVALLAFAMSFDALTELARGAGIRAAIAWMWPVVVDGSMIVATAAALVLRSSPDRATRVYPWTQLALFGLVSVIGNGLHAHGADTGSGMQLPGPIAVAVSGVPPVALLLSTHLLVMMLPRWRWTPEDHEDAPADQSPATREPAQVVATPEPDRPAPAPEPSVAPESDQQQPTPAGTAPTDQVDREPVTPTRAADPSAAADEPAALAAWVSEQERAGVSVSGQSVSEHLGVSLSTGKRRLRAARELLAEQ